MNKKTMLTFFVFIISANGLFPLGEFYFIYPTILFLFLMYFVLKKEWFEVSVSLSFFIFASITVICLPIIIFLIIAFSFQTLRRTLCWLKTGKQDKISKLLVILTSITSVISLLIWAGNSSYLGVGINTIKGLLVYNYILIVTLFIPLFAVVNALIEEFMFRGILQESLRMTFKKSSTIIILQSIPFAAFHYAVGFPNGVIGFLMVFIWGSVLGYLRERTNGLLAPMICHIAADLTIGYYLFYCAAKLIN
jgi:membrane protease YdiL (CAAX protease family)